MTAVLIIAAAAAVIAAGFWLRWATGPCSVAYELGKEMGWRQGRRGREQLTRALADATRALREHGLPPVPRDDTGPPA